MKRFEAFEDSALEARLERLRRSEVDLQDRVHERIAQAERERRWVPSDPVYQRLSSLLKQVRVHLEETQQEHQRRLEQRAQHASQANSTEVRAKVTARGSEERAKVTAPGSRVSVSRTLPEGSKQPAAAQAAAILAS